MGGGMGLQVRGGAQGGRSGVGEGVWIRGAGVGREACKYDPIGGRSWSGQVRIP